MVNLYFLVRFIVYKVIILKYYFKKIRSSLLQKSMVCINIKLRYKVITETLK